MLTLSPRVATYSASGRLQLATRALTGHSSEVAA
jgi:hypothetical protein